MRSRRFLAATLLITALAAPAAAQNTADLEPVEIIVDRPGDLPPVVDEPVRIRVRVTNLGPDIYDGTSAPKARRYAALQGGRLTITIDIDEPSKPDPDVASTILSSVTLVDSFAVNIAVGDTVTLDFGLTSYAPSRSGLHGISALSTPGSGNIDPVSGNDVLNSFFVVLPVTPAVGALALAFVAATLFGVAGRRFARRRARFGALRT